MVNRRIHGERRHPPAAEGARTRDGALRRELAARPNDGRHSGGVIAVEAKDEVCSESDIAVHQSERSRLTLCKLLNPRLRPRPPRFLLAYDW